MLKKILGSLLILVIVLVIGFVSLVFIRQDLTFDALSKWSSDTWKSYALGTI